MTVATLAHLGITEDHWDALDPESRRLIRSGCLGKTIWQERGAKESARRLIRQGKECRAYRCPFTLKDHHWHVGHVPTMATLEGIARTIRDLHGDRPTATKGTP